MVASLDNKFSASLQANVLDNISGDTPAFEWSKIKTKWPHLQSIPFQNVAKRRQIDVLIGSDNPIFHHVLQEVHGEAARDPIARKTSLGWVCFGPTLTEEFRQKSSPTSHVHSAQTKSKNEVSPMMSCGDFGT